MKIGLVSYRCENGNLPFNLAQIERALRETQGKADLLCFGETFLQGFDALCWDYEKDRAVGVSRDSETFARLKQLTVKTGVDLLTGYIEAEGDALYSSCALIEEGKLLFLYRRISKGWKEYTITDAHYREGDEVASFVYRGKRCCIALCGDLWDAPERFRQNAEILFWPVYICYTPEEWQNGILEDYAAQTEGIAGTVLLVNSFCPGDAFGGCAVFRNGTVDASLPMTEESLLLVDIE